MWLINEEKVNERSKRIKIELKTTKTVQNIQYEDADL